MHPDFWNILIMNSSKILLEGISTPNLRRESDTTATAKVRNSEFARIYTLVYIYTRARACVLYICVHK